MDTGNLRGSISMVQAGQGEIRWYSGKLFCLYIVVSVTILAKSQIETVWDSNP